MKRKEYYEDDDNCSGIKLDINEMKSMLSKANRLRLQFGKVQFGNLRSTNLDKFVADLEEGIRKHYGVINET